MSQNNPKIEQRSGSNFFKWMVCNFNKWSSLQRRREYKCDCCGDCGILHTNQLLNLLFIALDRISHVLGSKISKNILYTACCKIPQSQQHSTTVQDKTRQDKTRQNYIMHRIMNKYKRHHFTWQHSITPQRKTAELTTLLVQTTHGFNSHSVLNAIAASYLSKSAHTS